MSNDHNDQQMRIERNVKAIFDAIAELEEDVDHIPRSLVADLNHVADRIKGVCIYAYRDLKSVAA
jgi:hypothetical protein